MVRSLRESGMPPLIGPLVRLSVRHPSAIVFLWLVFIALFGSFSSKLPSVAQEHGLTPAGDAEYVQRQIAFDYGIPPNPVLLVFESDERGTAPAFRAFIAHALQTVHALQGIFVAASPLEQPGMLKAHSAYAMLALDDGSSAIDAGLMDELNRRLPREEHYRAGLTGNPVVQGLVNEASREDLAKAERFGIPAACLLLWLAFGGLLPALIPVVTGIVAVTGTMGLLYFAGKHASLSVFILDVVPMAGLALCLDFALMIVSRFRDEVADYPPDQAVFRTMATSGRAVAYSGACVGAGLAGTLFIPLPMFTSLALGATAVTLVSLLVNVTLVPAILVLTDPYLRRKPKRRRGRASLSVWERLPRFAAKRPVGTCLLCGGLLLACLLPLGGMRVAVPDADSLPRGDAARAAYHAYRENFSSDADAEVDLLLRAEDGRWDGREQRGLEDFRAAIEEDPLVRSVSLVQYPEPPEAAEQSLRARSGAFGETNAGRWMCVMLRGDPASAEARNWVRDWQGGAAQGSLIVYAGGEAKYEQEIYDAVVGHLPLALGFVLVATYVLLFASFRSVFIPLKSLLMNTISISAAFGVLALAARFGLFGMEAGRVAIMIPVFIFGLVFGISMDYGVFLISRIAEAYARTEDNALAIAEGSGQSGKIISAAAAIMIAVTLPFAWGRIEGVKQLGIGISTAILIDATIVRMLLVPSLMSMLGKWNWWGPRRQGKR
ncbi:MMPL family transporter [Paenibacillus sacheonensis]|uniref:MMPL family transporter n=1 Tax=Paenibacillus sacheonensis TaxID=742054 RepID=A0A7X4YNT1_9BACL|nr:MMPL family transporter [Paenibacillus sacheonensis]MBM7565821.1 RND superfamily putative drug exporter [Paenibacillus sacheonensis]NBC68859.1 MMPL family transporter [Paenibacillus sacheonensis]